MTGSFSIQVSPARLMREVAGSDSLLDGDGGIICTASGSTIILPAYDPSQLGFLYNIKNASTGDIVITSASGETFQESTGTVSTFTAPTNFSVQFGRNATNPTCWVIQ